MHCSEQKTRPLGQAVKTPPFHGGNRGSIPLGVTICGYRISVILQPSKLERWVRFPLPTLLVFTKGKLGVVDGLSPSGKAQDFDSCIHQFESG